MDREAARINNPDFIEDDPVQFPRRFSRKEDIEIAALLSATIAWGNRKMICANCNKLLALMEHDPYHYVMERGYEDLPDMNIHRTFFASNLRHYLRGLHDVYGRYGSLEDFAVAVGASSSQIPAWVFAKALGDAIADANEGERDSRCLPANMDTTALKRINMALRWLVRNDGIVDIGIWSSIHPRQLFIPLDVHVGRVSRQMGLLARKSNDRKAVAELTEALRSFRPDDPVIYDFALFGLGMEDKKATKPQF